MIWPVFKKKRAGVTLVELMVALGITTILGVGIAGFITTQQETANQMKYAMNMRAIANQIEAAVQNPLNITTSAMFSSLPGNQLLRGCIMFPVRIGPGMVVPTGATPLIDPASGATVGYSYGKCTAAATDPQHQVPIELFLASTPSGALTPTAIDPKILASNRLTGTSDRPVFYRLKDGVMCLNQNKVTGQCQVEARAYFWATCPANDDFLNTAPNGAAAPPSFAPRECLTADAVHIRFQITHHFTESRSAKGLVTKVTRQIPAIPSDELFFTDSTHAAMSTLGATTISVKQLPTEQYYQFSCPQNFTMTRVNVGAAKQVECECLYPFQLTRLDYGREICTLSTSRCRPNQRYCGTDLRGNPLCQDLDCTQTLRVPESQGCGPGGWIRDFSYSIPHDKPGGQTYNNACLAQDMCYIWKNGGTCQKEVKVKCSKVIQCCYQKGPCHAN